MKQILTVLYLEGRMTNYKTPESRLKKGTDGLPPARHLCATGSAYNATHVSVQPTGDTDTYVMDKNEE